MKLIYTDHLKARLKERGISPSLVKEIFDRTEENYWDKLRKHHIVIASVIYKSKRRKVLAAYDKRSLSRAIAHDMIEESAEVITVHPITDEQIKQRLTLGRWKHEESKN